MSSQQTPSTSPERRGVDGADIVDEHGHGHSVAAWAGVGVCLVGFLVLSLAVVGTSLVWGIVGSAIILASLVVAAVLAKAGYGVKTAGGRAVGVGRPRH